MICLLPHCAYLSETSRMLEIHRALRERGVAVRVATHGGTYEHLLRRAGVPYDVLGPRMDPARCAAFVGAGVGLGDARQSMYSDDELRTYVRAEAEYFRAHGIRVAVTGFTLTTLLSTRLAGVRLVTEHAGSFVPPVFERGLLPLPVRPPARVFRFLPRAPARRMWNAAPARQRLYCGGFNRVAAELGLPEVPSLAALLLGDLSLVPEVPEVLGIPAAEIAAWRPRSPSAYRPEARLLCTGPLYAHLPGDLPPRVARFLDAPGPTVYVAITSSPPGLVRAVVRALTTLDVRVLVAATVHDLEDLAGERVLIEPILPSHLVMPRVELAVTAGGQGSVQTAMAGGTPVLGIPLQPEQDLNVVLLERLDAARRIAPDDAATPRLAAAAAQMLADGRHRTAAGRVRDLYAAVNGPARAAEAIVELAVRSGATSAAGR